MNDYVETLGKLRSAHRARSFAMEQRKRANLATGSFLRTQLGWRKDLPEGKGEAIRAKAADFMKIAEKDFAGKPVEVPEGYHAFRKILLANIQSRVGFDGIEADTAKEMETLVKSLPIWSQFAEATRGLGAVSVGVILAETGDLCGYASPAKVWKRMGLAVMDGRRQGNPANDTGKEGWIEHGYSPKRRSLMFVIGDVMVKVGKEYRQVYLDRKEYLRNRATEQGFTVKPAAQIKKAPEKDRVGFISDGQIHLSAQRYMEKRLLRDIWREWRAIYRTEELK